MDDAELTEFFLTHKNVVIVVRRQELASKFAADRFDLVFNSSNSNFKIYRPGDWASSEKSPAVVR